MLQYTKVNVPITDHVLLFLTSFTLFKINITYLFFGIMKFQFLSSLKLYLVCKLLNFLY